MEPASDGWDRDLDLLVIDLSIEQAYECFWADEAPFLLPAFQRKENNYVVNWTLWADPSAEDIEIFGENVLAVRKLEQRIPSSHTDRLYTAPIQISHLALMSQDETSFTIMNRMSYVGSPYAQSH